MHADFLGEQSGDIVTPVRAAYEGNLKDIIPPITKTKLESSLSYSL